MNAAWIDSTDQKSSKFRIPWLKRRAASHHSLQLPTEGIFDPQNADAVEKYVVALELASPPKLSLHFLIFPSSEIAWPMMPSALP